MPLNDLVGDLYEENVTRMSESDLDATGRLWWVICVEEIFV